MRNTSDTANAADGQNLARAIVLVVGLLTASLTSFGAGLLWRYIKVVSTPGAPQTFGNPKRQLLAIGTILLISITLASMLPKLKASFSAWMELITPWLKKHTEVIDGLSGRNLGLWIALSAGSGLFVELMMIRLHSTSFQLLSHFKNVSLMSCFLGLGIGYALGHRKLLSTPFVIPLLAIQVVFIKLVELFGLSGMVRSPAIETWNVGVELAATQADILTSYGFLSFMFVLNALLFIPMGQLSSRLMSRRPKLVAYNWNLVGSLLGILAFTALSFVWLPPAVWIAIGVLSLFPFFVNQPSVLMTSSVSVLLALALWCVPNRGTVVSFFSPYQIISIAVGREQTSIIANNTWFQMLLDLTPAGLKRVPTLDQEAAYYALPYDFKKNPKNVLIVGSGTGNDVAAAIRNGAQHVDAVEIDPAVVHIGQTLHPENPYGNAKVSVHVDDARAFIRHTKNKYDLIIYALLDSHTMHSGNSAGMRMDSYVWTEESFKEAAKLLTPTGVLSISVCADEALGPKAFRMVRTATDGAVPFVYHTKYDSGITFLAGKGLTKPNKKIPFPELTQQYLKDNKYVEPATDDWPFFFMYKRSYPIMYMTVIGFLLGVSALLIGRFNAQPAATFVRQSFNWPCFFLGAGFMLVETKGITELALVYGSTWIVTSIVITAILLLALGANILVQKVDSPPRVVSAVFLVLSLLAGYAVSVTGIGALGLPPVAERLAMTLILTLPLFFSGFAFSSELARSSSIAGALSSNLLGGMLGGFLEYNSMYLGFRALYLVAIALYILALLTSGRKRQRVAEEKSTADTVHETKLLTS